MIKKDKRTRRFRQKQIYNIITNPKAAEYSREKVDKLCQKIVDAGGRYFLSEPDSAKNVIYHAKRAASKGPVGIIVCGGDSTVNLVARHIIRRTISLGIIPMGRFNNIYRSLYGEPDFETAVAHIMSGKDRKIDYGLAAGNFFLGSLSLGLIPQLHGLLENRKTPRFAISWSRLAAQAAAMIEVKPLSFKVDAFGFDFSPQTISVNLLPYSSGIPLVPSCIFDDGKCEVSFDIGEGQAIMSSYIRQIYKKKFIYSDEIRLYRGERVSISSVKDSKIYIDGELITMSEPELKIETFSQKVRIFFKPDIQNQ